LFLIKTQFCRIVNIFTYNKWKYKINNKHMCKHLFLFHKMKVVQFLFYPVHKDKNFSSKRLNVNIILLCNDFFFSSFVFIFDMGLFMCMFISPL